MKNNLKLRLEPDGESSGELFVEFTVSGFSGHASAWFDIGKLRDHADQFSRFPLPAVDVIHIASGIWDRVSATNLIQEHVYIAAYPLNSRGGVVLRVRLQIPEDNNESIEPQYSASVNFHCGYEEVGQFSKNLRLLATGEIEEFTLELANNFD